MIDKTRPRVGVPPPSKIAASKARTKRIADKNDQKKDLSELRLAAVITRLNEIERAYSTVSAKLDAVKSHNRAIEARVFKAIADMENRK